MKIHNTTLMLIGHTAAMTQWMAQPIASGVRVYTASPQHPPPPHCLSLSVCHNGQFAYLRPSSITRPKPFWPHHSQGLHLNLPSHSHFLFNTCSSLLFFLLLSTMLCQLLALNRYFCLLSPDVTLAIVERVIAGNCFILLLLLLVCMFFLWYLYFCNIKYGIFFQCCCDASG